VATRYQHESRVSRVDRPTPVSTLTMTPSIALRVAVDGGLDISSEKRKTVDALLEELEEIGKTQVAFFSCVGGGGGSLRCHETGWS
jgi:hypothetical protein